MQKKLSCIHNDRITVIKNFINIQNRFGLKKKKLYWKPLYILDQDLANVRLSVCPSVYPSAKLLYTKTYERIKLIKFGVFVGVKAQWNFNEFFISQDPIHRIDSVFFVLKVWTIKKHMTRLDPIARRFPNLELNEGSSCHILVSKLNNQLNIS